MFYEKVVKCLHHHVTKQQVAGGRIYRKQSEFLRQASNQYKPSLGSQYNDGIVGSCLFIFLMV